MGATEKEGFIWLDDLVRSLLLKTCMKCFSVRAENAGKDIEAGNPSSNVLNLYVKDR